MILSMLMRLALHWLHCVRNANFPFDQPLSQIHRESGQREWTTGMHGKVDYVET